MHLRNIHVSSYRIKCLMCMAVDINLDQLCHVCEFKSWICISFQNLILFLEEEAEEEEARMKRRRRERSKGVMRIHGWSIRKRRNTKWGPLLLQRRQYAFGMTQWEHIFMEESTSETKVTTFCFRCYSPPAVHFLPPPTSARLNAILTYMGLFHRCYAIVTCYWLRFSGKISAVARHLCQPSSHPSFC